MMFHLGKSEDRGVTLGRIVTSAMIVLWCAGAAPTAQRYIKVDPQRTCSYYGEVPGEELVVFEPDSEAVSFVAGIAKHTGISQNFKIYAGNVRNALAHYVPSTGERQIIYSQEFMRAAVNNSGARWPAISVMAHEIGHHLIGHALAPGGGTSKRERELEADKFSGHVLRKMNATLEQAKVAMERQPEMGQFGYPDRSARLAAIQNGWIEADEQLRSTTKPAAPETPVQRPVRDPEPEPPVKKPEVGDIRISYDGDYFACTLSLTVTVGGKSVTPSRNSVTLRGVPLGEQEYRIRGRIGCPAYGVCEARGSGTIDVEPGEEYRIVWSNTAYARCEVALR